MALLPRSRSRPKRITSAEADHQLENAAAEPFVEKFGEEFSPVLTPDEGTGAGGRRQLAVNAAAGGVANLIKIGIQLVMLPVMAHFLGPAEFGLYALAMPTVSLLAMIADGGLGTSLAKEESQRSIVWSTAFWVLMIAGVGLMFIVAGWGLVLAVLAHQPRLSGIMGFLSLSFILLTSSILPAARLTRQGRLVVLAANDLTATIIGSGVGLACAASGAGAWSLAAQYVIGFLARTIFLNSVAFVRPRLEFRLASLQSHLMTGSAVLGGRLCDFTGRLLENLFYGRTFGTAALGTYTFANQAPRFLCEAASSPVWSALYSFALRASPKEVGALQQRLLFFLAAATFPMAFLVSAAAPELLNLLLGPKWIEAANLLRILIPFYALQVLASQSGAILIAHDRSAAFFWSTLGLTAGRVAAVLVGIWFGQMAIAYGIGAVYVVYTIYMFATPARTTGCSGERLLGAIAGPLLAGAGAGMVCFWLLNRNGPGLLSLISGVAVGGLAYVLLLVVFAGPRVSREFRAVRTVISSRGMMR